jgi:hypothetical protein
MSVNPPPDPDVSIFNNLYWTPDEGGSILGTNNTFTGTNTFNNDFTLNQSKIHLGSNAVASGQNSIAIGISATTGIGADSSIAIGNSVSVGTNSGAVAIGSDLTTNGGASVNIGTFSTAGSGAISMGYNASATGIYAIAIGRSAAAAFLYAVSIGYQATCTAANQITLGTTISTIRLNTITPLYTAIPTFTSAQVGFISTTSGVNSTALTSAGATTILITASMPIGLYTIFVRVTMTSTHPNDVGVTINLNDAAAANVIKGQTIINSTTAPPLFMSIPYSNSSAQAFTLTGIFNAGVGHNAVIANTGSSLTNVQILRIA